MFNDVVVFGVGHSGTSLLAKMLHTLGWEPNDADVEFAESVRMRDLNREIIANGRRPEHELLQVTFIKSLARPFAIKDPRLVETLPGWASAFKIAGLKPTLLMIERDRDALAKSYLDRDEVVGGQPGTRHKTLSQMVELAAAQFDLWPHSKMVVQYERLIEAALLAKDKGAMRRAGGLWLAKPTKVRRPK